MKVSPRGPAAGRLARRRLPGDRLQRRLLQNHTCSFRVMFIQFTIRTHATIWSVRHRLPGGRLRRRLLWDSTCLFRFCKRPGSSFSELAFIFDSWRLPGGQLQRRLLRLESNCVRFRRYPSFRPCVVSWRIGGGPGAGCGEGTCAQHSPIQVCKSFSFQIGPACRRLAHRRRLPGSERQKRVLQHDMLIQVHISGFKTGLAARCPARQPRPGDRLQRRLPAAQHM